MKKIFKTENLCCANCAAKMENKIKKLHGVNDVGISIMTQKMFIDADDENFDAIVTKAADICKKIEKDFNMI
ncbi:MAG: cation transporter [Clostridia bacterium]|jgi:copper chaperone CopZ|nr:cation transporter [Clostridia bacterium]MCI1999162.1 cation transporter [Clostridia bacterium]MCI2014885.1 cation transporter [Clostridia bacterium]